MCKRSSAHYWYLFDCKVSGKVKPNYDEMKSIGWYSPKEITELKKPPPEKIELPEDREFFIALNRWLGLQRKMLKFSHNKSEKF